MKKIYFFLFLCFIFLLSSQIAAIESVKIDFTNIKTHDLLKIIAERARKNVIVSEKVKGRVSVNLKGVSWDKVLDVVLKMQGLIKHEADGVMMILTSKEAEKRRQTILKPQIFSLQNIGAESVAKFLKPSGVLSDHGKVGVDVKNNYLIVTDAENNAKSLKGIINKIDRPAERILIEARIVSADETFLRELGVELNTHNVNVLHGIKNKASALNLSYGQFNFAIANLGDNNLLDMKLRALEDKGRGRVISKPKLLTTNRQSAYIESGAEIPYQEKTKEGNTSIAFKKAVLSLEVTPEIVAGNKINLNLKLNQDKVGQLFVNNVPTIDTRKIHTKVLVKDNETIVLGGIYEWTKSKRVISMPILGQIPILKVIFSKNEDRIERREILIFVTPKIIK